MSKRLGGINSWEYCCFSLSAHWLPTRKCVRRLQGYLWATRDGGGGRGRGCGREEPICQLDFATWSSWFVLGLTWTCRVWGAFVWALGLADSKEGSLWDLRPSIASSSFRWTTVFGLFWIMLKTSLLVAHFGLVQFLTQILYFFCI